MDWLLCWRKRGDGRLQHFCVWRTRTFAPAWYHCTPPVRLTPPHRPPSPRTASYDTMGCCSDTPYNLDEDSCCKEGDNYVVHSADAHACDCSKYGCQ